MFVKTGRSRAARGSFQRLCFHSIANGAEVKHHHLRFGLLVSSVLACSLLDFCLWTTRMISIGYKHHTVADECLSGQAVQLTDNLNIYKWTKMSVNVLCLLQPVDINTQKNVFQRGRMSCEKTDCVKVCNVTCVTLQHYLQLKQVVTCTDHLMRKILVLVCLVFKW